MSIPSKQAFMQVKEKLDQYRLPTTFPPEATGIISKLLQKLQQKQPLLQTDRTRQSLNNRSTQLSPRNNQRTQSFTQLRDNENSGYGLVVQALQSKLKQLLRENHGLMREVAQAKEYIQVLKECKQLKIRCDSIGLSIGKNNSHSNTSTNQIAILRNGFQVLKAREIQLFQELTQTKFKYNELMDLLHEDPHVEKQYIKRLMKHKRMDVSCSNDIVEKGFRSEAAYTTQNPNLSPSTSMTLLQTQNFKLFSLNRTLKQKVEQKQIHILKLQNRLIDQFNVEGLVKAYQLERKEEEVKGLKERVEMLVDRLGKMGGDMDKDKGDQVWRNCINNGNRTKERTVSTNKKTPQQDNKIITTQKTINHNKSPPPITTIKSPPKPSQPLTKPLLLPTAKSPINPAKQRTDSRQRKTMKSPQPQTPHFLQKQNQKLRQQVENLRKEVERLRKGQEAEVVFSNQVIRDSRNSQANSNGNKDKDKGEGNNKDNNKQVGQYQEELNTLKQQLAEKDTTIKKIEQRWKQVQEQNRILIQQLSEKRKYVENFINNKNNTINSQGQGINTQGSQQIKKEPTTEKNIVTEANNQGNQDNFKTQNNNKTQNNAQNNPTTNNHKSPFNKKPPTHSINNKMTNNPSDQIKKTAGMRTTNIQTTSNNLLSTNINPSNNPPPTQTPFYSPSEYTRSQKNPSSNRVYSQKIDIDLRSQNDSYQDYPSNIHSRVSSERDERESKKSERRMKLHDIVEEESLEKSHHSEEEAKSRVKQSHKPPHNMPGIRISIKNNNQQVQQKYYQNRGFSDHSAKRSSQKEKQHHSQISPVPKNSYSYQPNNNGVNNNLDNSQEQQEDTKGKGNNGQNNFLDVQDSDKASVWSMRKQIDQLKLQNRKQTKTKKKLQKSLKQVQQQKSKLQDRILMLENIISELQQQAKHPPLALTNKQDSSSLNASSSQQIDRKLKQKIRQQDERIAQLEEENVQTLLQIRDRDAKIRSLQERIEEISGKMEGMRENVKSLGEENQGLKKEREKLMGLGAKDLGNDHGGLGSSNNRTGLTKPDQSKPYQHSPTSSPPFQQQPPSPPSFQPSTQILWLKKQIKTLQTRIQKYNTTITQLNDYISMHRQQKEKLSIQKLNLQKENDYLKKKLMELERALTIQAEEMKRYRETFEM